MRFQGSELHQVLFCPEKRWGIISTELICLIGLLSPSACLDAKRVLGQGQHFKGPGTVVQPLQVNQEWQGCPGPCPIIFRPLPSRTIGALNLFLGHLFLQESGGSLNRYSLEKMHKPTKCCMQGQSMWDLRRLCMDLHLCQGEGVVLGRLCGSGV